MRRPYLVPAGFAIAAFGPHAAAAQVAQPADGKTAVDARSIGPGITARLQQPLLATAHRGRAPAAAASTRLHASLTVSQVVPQPAVAGVGAFGTFTATLSGRILAWRLTVSHLSGSVVAAVVHAGARGHTGARLMRLCGPCATSAHGTLVLTQAQVTQLLGGASYLNVGTHRNPAGEIRGQIIRQPAVQVTVPPVAGGGGSHVSHVSHVSHASHSSHVSGG